MAVRLREHPGKPILGRNRHCLKGHDRLTFVADFYRLGCALDVASGQGAFAIWLQHQGCEVTMLDILPIGRPIPGIEFVQMDLLNMTYDQEFDTILLMEIIEHLLDPASAVALCYRALKPGGVLLITTPWIDRWDGEQDHVWRFDERGVKELLEPYRGVVWIDDIFVYGVVEKS